MTKLYNTALATLTAYAIAPEAIATAVLIIVLTINAIIYINKTQQSALAEPARRALRRQRGL